MIIAIDMHGADMGLRAPLVGGLEALEDRQDLNLIFCGEQSQLEKAFEGRTYDKSRVTICACGEPVTNNDHPGIVIRRKKDASMFRALELVRDGKADAMVSAGNTGALLALREFLSEYVIEEVLRSRALRRCEHFFGPSCLYHFTLVHEYDLVSRRSCESHLMRHKQHRHSFFC